MRYIGSAECVERTPQGSVVTIGGHHYTVSDPDIDLHLGEVILAVYDLRESTCHAVRSWALPDVILELLALHGDLLGYTPLSPPRTLPRA
jgi:hypothetical protein